MITYIYFVKCPNCEDEHFDFFDEAKEFALGCLSQKPIITQTEVCRNDFGECTDSCDLGTVWSWEDMMSDDGYTEAEPTKSIFTKDDLKLMADGKDSEFDNLDNSVDFEPKILDRKPIPEGMTIEQLVEEMEENEDTVECAWCEELFDKDQCRKEVNLGWLCSRCEAAIKSRGETLTFKENNYWDFLDEDIEGTRRDPFDHHDPDYDEDEAADYLADRIDNAKDAEYDKSLEEANSYPWDDEVELSYSDLTYKSKHFGPYDFKVTKDRITDVFVDLVTDEDIKALSSRFNTIDEISEYDDTHWVKDHNAYRHEWSAFLEDNFDALFAKYEDEIYKYFTEEAIEAFKQEEAEIENAGETFDGFRDYDDFSRWRNESLTATDPDLSSASEKTIDYRSHITLCPECGDNAFDTETGICISCGFN